MSRRIKHHPILESIPKKEIFFYYNSTKYKALQGEMISSALFANGINIFGHHPKDNFPLGLFCANGQCSQCQVIADGKPVKACVTEVKDGMHVFPVEGFPLLADSMMPSTHFSEIVLYKAEVLIMGGGPAGLTAAIELAKEGKKIIIADDKNSLGGKLTLQTHNFFGSKDACFAGERGTDIGYSLEKELLKYSNVEVWLNSPVVGIFDDKKIGVVKDGKYCLIKPDYFLIAAGAREKVLSFSGADLPGVYGAGAFQTLVNRDLVKAAENLFIIGGGNVGLIAAYHALQAGINVKGLVEVMPECGGYKVHIDKIKRLGIPVWNSHTVVRAEGNGKLEKIIIAKVDKNYESVPGTEREFRVDTLLLAVGLSSVNEIYKQAVEFGFNAYVAGDADQIAEASAAIFSGKIIGRKILLDMGCEVSIPHTWYDTAEILKSRPGNTFPLSELIHIPEEARFYPVIRCNQEIPCNPCIDSCPNTSIKLRGKTIMDVPVFTDNCIGCGKCVAVCPGLAITLVNKTYDKARDKALVVIPWEMPESLLKVGDIKLTTGFEGEVIGAGKVVKIQSGKWMNKRRLVHLEVAYAEAELVAGIQIQNNSEGEAAELSGQEADEEVYICRCERVTRSQIIKKIKEGYRDFNALKAELRVGMGACGGKTCMPQIWNIYRECGIANDEIEQHAHRPFEQEVPMEAFLK